MSIRIGIICPYSLSLPGGVQGQVLALGRALRHKGYETRVLGPCDGPPPDAGVTPLGNCLPTAANGSMAPIAPDPAAQLRTIRALRDEAFDVLHLHEPLAPGPTMTALLLKPAPIVATFHAAGASKAYQFGRMGVRWGARRIDRRFAVSPDAQAMAEEALGGTYTVLFNGVEIDRLATGDAWPTTGPTVFFLGRHEPRKGLGVLLDALTHLPRDVRLWIGGDGPETRALQARVAGDPRVEWLGRISEEEKHLRLRGADVFCAPALRGESFGIVLLEAMAAGTPVVASDIAGYRNVARPGIDAEMVPPDDPAALAAGLVRVLRDPVLAENLRCRGRERAESMSMDRLADLYVAVYEELAG
jgi:phosphatidylinositol alpha-mannosyltransferase